MRNPRIVAGAVAVVVLVAIGSGLVALRGGGAARLASPAAVKQAFAEHGITVRYTGQMTGNPDVRTQPPLGALTTRLDAVSRGDLDVLVLRNLRDAKRLAALRMNLASRDECGRRESSDVLTWRVKNVIATYDRCDFSRTPHRLGSKASYDAVRAALGDLGRYSLSR